MLRGPFTVASAVALATSAVPSAALAVSAPATVALASSALSIPAATLAPSATATSRLRSELVHGVAGIDLLQLPRRHELLHGVFLAPVPNMLDR